MKKILMILMTAAAMTAMSCGDGRTARDVEDETGDNTELADPDSTMMESDTTTMNDMNHQQDGESRDNLDRTQQDSIQ